MKKYMRSGFFEILFAILFILFTSQSNPVYVFVSCSAHELSHLFCCLIFGIKLGNTSVGIAGLRINYSPSVISYSKELCVILSGCFVNLLIAVTAGFLGFNSFAKTNFALFAVNLIPIRGLDGGEALRLIVGYFTDGYFTDKITKCISVVISSVIWIVAIYFELRCGVNLSLLFLCVYLIIRAVT